MPSSPLNDFRISMGVVQSEIRVLEVIVSMMEQGLGGVRQGIGGWYREDES